MLASQPGSTSTSSSVHAISRPRAAASPRTRALPTPGRGSWTTRSGSRPACRERTAAVSSSEPLSTTSVSQRRPDGIRNSPTERRARSREWDRFHVQMHTVASSGGSPGDCIGAFIYAAVPGRLAGCTGIGRREAADSGSVMQHSHDDCTAPRMVGKQGFSVPTGGSDRAAADLRRYRYWPSAVSRHS